MRTGILNQNQNNPNEQIGVVPTSRPAPPPRVNFAYKNYEYIDEPLMINLPIRPDNLTKQSEQHLCNILKQIAIDLEKDNNNKFIAYCRSRHGDKAWWQAGGNSVLFYHYYYEKSHRLTPVKVRSDGDYGCKWPDDQVIMIQKIDYIIGQLIDKVHAKFLLDTPELIILELPTHFPPDTIASLRKIRQNKKEAINKLLLPKIVHPHTHQDIADLHRYLANRVLKLTEPQRVAYGYSGLELIKNLSIRFRLMSNGAIPVKDYYTEALATIDEFCSWLLIVQDIKLIDVDSLYELIIRANKVKEDIINELQQL